MTTDTPRTDAAEPQLHSNVGGWVRADFARQLERELAISLQNQCKAQAEIKEIRNALGDDGRRTHKEILEMAFKASGWKVWKEKYIDLRNAHIAEGQDPAGTIWEHADKLQKELKEAKAEVERLTKRPFGCKCETFREKALGDGCEECNKALVIEMLTDERDELDAEVDRLNNILENTRMSRDTMIEDRNILDQELAASEAEVESLREKLDTAIEIAKDALWYARIYENEIHFNKMDGLYQKLVALKNK
jgi:chromosome segregation ATPase